MVAACGLKRWRVAADGWLGVGIELVWTCLQPCLALISGNPPVVGIFNAFLAQVLRPLKPFETVKLELHYSGCQC